MRPTTVALTLATSVLTLTLVAGENEKFDERLKEATQNQASETGRKYAETFTKEFSTQYAPRLSECLEQTGDTAPQDFEMLLRLAGDGEVEMAMVKPETKLAACFRDLTKKTKYPAPPSAGYWHVVGIRFPEN